MTTKSKFKVFVTLFIVWLSASIYIVTDQLDTISNKVAQTIKYRSLNIQQEINVALILAEQLRKQVEYNILLTNSEKLKNNINSLKDYPKLGIYSTDLSHNNVTNPHFSLTGSGSFSAINRDTRNEINAVLLLALSTKTLAKINPDFEWVYYVSKNNFLAITPTTSINDFHFDNELFKNEFWEMSTPENNPERKMQITALYDDFWGKGNIFTLTSPVYVNDEFKGVAAVDLKTNKLVEHFQLTNLPGTPTLVDENGSIVAANYDFKIGQKVKDFSLINDKNGRFILNDDYSSSYIFPVIKNELYLVHRVTLIQKLSQLIAPNMLASISIISGLTLTIFLLLTLRKTLAKNIKLANYDNLTELYNRRTIKNKTKHLFQVSSTQELYVLMLDIDKFKSINDTYGHSMGDKVIRQVSDILKECCATKSNFISRLGGEEFLVIIPNIAAEEVQQIAEQIRQDLEACHISHPHNQDISTKVTISIGVVKRRSEETYDNAINRADVNLYKAKNTGRNRVEMTI